MMMALAHRRSHRTTCPLVLFFLLITFLVSNAASSRLPLQLQNDSADRSVALSDEQVDQDLDGPVLTLPEFIDRAISSAFSSVDRMSSGLLSGLAGPNIEYGQSKDGKRLIARLHLPPVHNKDEKATVAPKISIAVLGRSHLRVKLDMHGDGYQSFSEHTYGLPVHVSSDDIKVTPQEDGTVHVSLRIVKGANEVSADSSSDHGTDNEPMNSFLDRRLRNPIFPMLIHRDSLKDPDSEEVVEELPRAEDVESCRARYPNEKILRKKCICDVTPATSGKAVCYGSLISKAVGIARRLEMHDFATSAKHHAIECADGHTDAVQCLEKVASQLLHSLYDEDASGKSRGRLGDRVRAAIESEDDGPSNFQPSYGTMLFSLLMIALLVGLFACSAMFCSIRRFGGNSQSNRILCELSSVLTQTRRTNSAGTVSSGKGTCLGPLQGTSKPSNSRATRKPSPKPHTGGSKIA